jgi:hypothetical protein
MKNMAKYKRKVENDGVVIEMTLWDNEDYGGLCGRVGEIMREISDSNYS